MAGVRGRDGWWLTWHWSSTFFKEERGEKKEEIENGRDGEKRGGDKRERGEGEIWLYRPLALLDACTCYKKWGERERRKGRLLSLTSLAWSLVMAVLSSPGLYYLYSTIIPVSREKGEGWRERGGREGGIQLDSTATKCIRLEQIHCKSYMVMLTCNVMAIISLHKQTNCAISEVTQFKPLPIL